MYFGNKTSGDEETSDIKQRTYYEKRRELHVANRKSLVMNKKKNHTSHKGKYVQLKNKRTLLDLHSTYFVGLML